MGGRFWTALTLGLALGLNGCSPAIGLYHWVEGGAISGPLQPPPGMEQPYPNLADVPAAPKPQAPGAQAAIAARARTGVSAPSPEALAGLSLPAGPPPLPDVPGLDIPVQPAAMVVAAPAPVHVPPPPPGPPVAIGFVRGSALLPYAEATRIQAFARTRGTAGVLAGGFGEGDLQLALARARRLADALTADGVPRNAVRLTASAAGSGGFVQLVY
jgi:hypothetical protein